MVNETYYFNYANKVNHLKDLMMKIKDKGQSVYDSDVLSKAFNIANFNEKMSIDEYVSNKKISVDEKIKNLEKILSSEDKLLKENIKYINKSQDKYNQEFNENIDKLEYINKEIMTKDKLIMLNDIDSDQKERTVSVLRSIIIFILFMLIPIFASAINLISLGLCIGIVIFFGIITATVITINYYKSKDIDLARKTKDTAKEYAMANITDLIDKINPNFVPKCPARCQKKRPFIGEEEQIMMVKGEDDDFNEVSLDNADNRWVRGDVPVVGSNYMGYKKLGDAEPKPYYLGTKSGPSYICRWREDPTKMTNLNKGLKFTTSIPCEYYPGYETVSKC